MLPEVPHFVCLCAWTVKWAPEVRATLGMPGGFAETSEALFWGEVVLAFPLVVFMAFGRWTVSALVLALCAALPFALCLGLFGVGLGQKVLDEGQFELSALCMSVLIPAFVLGAACRLIWFAIRAFLLRAPQDLRA